MSKVLKIRSIQCLCNISRMNGVLKLMFSHADKQESLLQVDSIIFDRFGQACPNYSSKFAISFSHRKNEVRNKVRDLTPLAGSNITLTIYYTSNVLPPLTLFLSQYQIYTKLFLHLINCLCNISLFLFQVTVGPCMQVGLLFFFLIFVLFFFGEEREGVQILF